MEPRVSSPVLVGRSGQLSALEAALAGVVQGHPNILAKLGVTSRGEAAAAAHRLRLFDSFPGGNPEPD